MSEPVIKPTWVCDFCGPMDYEAHELDFRPPFRDAHKTRASYTRDDLVRVAEASRQMAWVQVYNELKSPTIVFEETPSEVVDRLTKGET